LNVHFSTMTDWESMWSRNGGLQPNTFFDIGGIAPTLQKLAEEGHVAPGKSYVPGCGRGFDVTFIAGLSPAHSCLGFDIAPTAVAAAEARRDMDTQVPPERAKFTSQDWFGATEGGYVFAYDYTFLCAIQTDMRSAWARQHFELLAPGGILATLIFPITGHEGGPPFAMTSDLVQSLLLPVGFELVSVEEVQASAPGREGKEKIALWRKPASTL
jgi:hypothetical protein